MSATIPFLTMIALAVMSSITGMHYRQVNKMVEHGALAPNTPLSVLASDVLPVSDEALKRVITNSPVPNVTHDSPATKNHAIAGNYENKREDALLEILGEMRRELRSMRSQIAETNRDLAEANFRLDATSNDFRPLRTDSERPSLIDSSEGPSDGNLGTPESLLPPKPN